ncbi:MAG: DegT/DnrJ/EryC1/StrS family aminotransferase [Candidatus Omnitrophota bacterium]
MKDRICVPFCDPGREYRALSAGIDKAVKRALSSGHYILGREVKAFEEEFAAYLGISFGIGVASGTEALQVALLACGIGPGDEVVTTANAGVPTVAAIVLTGATPVFVDIDPVSYNMDASGIGARVSKKTKAIIPIHLYGQCADMRPILAAARKHGLRVIEDACQAHGAAYGNKKAGTIGDVGCFSFYPTKNLGAYGDGGMIVTGDKDLAGKAVKLRMYGEKERYNSVIMGLNSRLDEVQAAMLRFKLKRLSGLNRIRARIAAGYDKGITNPLVSKPVKMPYGSHVYHLYVIRCARRDLLRAHLASRGIGTSVHYPRPAYTQKAYRLLARGRLRYTEEYSKKVLSLPLYPELKDAEIRRVIRAVNDFKV